MTPDDCHSVISTAADGLERRRGDVHLPNLPVYLPNLPVHLPNLPVHLTNLPVHLPNLPVRA